jgi:hypothetical protein
LPQKSAGSAKSAAARSSTRESFFLWTGNSPRRGDRSRPDVSFGDVRGREGGGRWLRFHGRRLGRSDLLSLLPDSKRKKIEGEGIRDFQQTVSQGISDSYLRWRGIEATLQLSQFETLAQLKPVFRPNGTITAGNAPGLNDAASAVVLADETWAEKRGLAATARLVSYGIAAVEPGMFGLGPIPAVRQALQRAGWDIRPFC